MTPGRAAGRGLRAAAPLVVASVVVLALCATTAAAFGADPVAKGAPPARPTTESELEARIQADPQAAMVLALCKFGPAAAGLVIGISWLVLERSKREAIRAGLLRPPATHRAPTVPFGIPTALLLFVVAQAVALGAALVADGLWPGAAKTVGVMLIVTGMGTIPVAVWIFECRRAARAPSIEPADETVADSVFGDRGSPPRAPVLGPVARTAATCCLAAFAVLACTIVVTVAMKAFGSEPEVQSLVTVVVSPEVPLDPWLILGFGVLIAPVTEEAIFRGGLYPALRRRVGPKGAAVIASAAFAAIHVNLAAALPLFALALILTWLFERTDSILAPTIVHALNNATSLAPLLMLRRSA